MDNKLKAGRIPKKEKEEPRSIAEKFEKELIRPDKIFGLSPSQLFVLSLEIFLLILVIGVMILFFTGKFAI